MKQKVLSGGVLAGGSGVRDIDIGYNRYIHS